MITKEFVHGLIKEAFPVYRFSIYEWFQMGLAPSYYYNTFYVGQVLWDINDPMMELQGCLVVESNMKDNQRFPVFEATYDIGYELIMVYGIQPGMPVIFNALLVGINVPEVEPLTFMGYKVVMHW